MSTKKKPAKKATKKTTEPIKPETDVTKNDLPAPDPVEAIPEAVFDTGAEGDTTGKHDAPVEATPEPAESTEPATFSASVKSRDERLPPVGTTITREYKGQQHEISFEADGILHAGKRYKSASALAKAITGYKAINGMVWLKLKGRWQDSE